MKRIFVLLVIGAMVLALVYGSTSCTSDDTPKKGDSIGIDPLDEKNTDKQSDGSPKEADSIGIDPLDE